MLLFIGLAILIGTIVLMMILMSFTSWPYWTYAACGWVLIIIGLLAVVIPEVRKTVWNIVLTPLRLTIGSPLLYRALVALMMRGAKRETYENLQLLCYFSKERDRTFFEKTRQALDFIKTHDVLNYGRVCQFLRLITNFGIGGHYDAHYQAFHVDRFRLQQETVESYASEMIHEAIHGRLRRCRIPYRGNAARHEHICKAVQIRFLRRVGQEELAQNLQFADNWWLPEPRRRSRDDYLKSLGVEVAKESGLVNRVVESGLGAMQKLIGGSKGNSEEAFVRTYKQGNCDVFECDYNKDGKTDCWIYCEGNTIRVEQDLKASGKIDRRTFVEGGKATRLEWDEDGDGVMERIGCVKYYKQDTESAIYWFTATGSLRNIQYRVGVNIVGQLTVSEGVITNAEGHVPHNVGERISMSLSNWNPRNVHMNRKAR